MASNISQVSVSFSGFRVLDERRKLRQVLDEGRVVFHISLLARSPILVEKLKGVPLDFAYIDLEHGSFDWESIENIMRAADLVDLPVLVRVEEKGYFDQVRKCLELGAQGVILPHTSSKGQVEDLVRAVKFPPMGERGIGPVRPFYVSPDPTQSNKDSIIYLLVEDPQGVENIDEILSVKGVDIVGVARADFSLAVGHSGQFDHPIVEAAVMKVIERARKAGVAPMIQFWAMGSKVKQYVDAGARVVSLGNDYTMFSQKCTETVNQVKELLAQ
jgi:4-hydroxy-2-oxoheptanedioate aldolase